MRRQAIAILLSSLPFAGPAFTGGKIRTPSLDEILSCQNGRLWEEPTATCREPDNVAMLPYQIAMIAEVLGRAGHYDLATRYLDLSSEQDIPVIIVMRGFILRKTGSPAEAIALYRQAVEMEPNLHLARSHLGQALLEAGDRDGARQQLIAIRDHGGEGSPPFVELTRALETGITD